MTTTRDCSNWSDGMANLPFVSIVICTYNRKNLLKECLNSISAMEYPKSSYEIIVVDGGSNDGTEELCKKFPSMRFVIERRAGLAHARNKGAELARGSIVAYTDDDCIVDKRWLRNLISGFQFSEFIAGVGGPVYPLHPEIIPEKVLVKPALGLFDEGNKVKTTRCVLTSNCAFRKEIFKTIRFDEALGATRRRKLLLCGEDSDFCQSIVSSGNRLLYVPCAVVYHQISEQRLRVPYIVRHAVHNGISQTRYFLKVKHSRIWAVRYSVGLLMQLSIEAFMSTHFTSCYGLVYSISTLVVSLTGLDRVFVSPRPDSL